MNLRRRQVVITGKERRTADDAAKGGSMQGQRYYLIYFDESGEMNSMDLSVYGQRRILIGKSSEQADIALPSEVISRVHASLLVTSEGIVYQDLHSRNGTDIVEFGSVHRLRQTDESVLLTNSAFLNVGGREGFFFFVRTMRSSEQWKRIAITSKPLTIGRLSDSDIVLNHPAVSKNQAQLYMKGKNVYLTDSGSYNGTRVNGHRIRGTVQLKNFDIIQIVDFQLIVSGGILYYSTAVHGIHLVAQDIVKQVGKNRKVLLDHVDVEIKSNEFVAIIGGSGAGKTTLMNAISGFDPDCAGTITFNGIDLKKKFNTLKDLIGFVPQQDIIYENLTLHDMLLYTAQMKMPKDTGRKEIERKITEVLEMVELEQHASTYIRKLSGGQKKRASIAVELLADPKLFFLDEPTSGLDPGTEKNLMMLLNRLAKLRDKTIVMVTHTTQSLQLCDKVIFMGPGGHLCFYGTVDQARMFFQTDDLVDIYNIIAKDPAMWAIQFKNCMEDEKRKIDSSGDDQVPAKRKIAWIRQWSVLTRRYLRLILNDRMRLLILLAQPAIIGALLTVVADDKVFDIYESTQSMLFSLSCAAIWIGLFNTIQEVCKERVILKREYMANLKLPMYILSKVAVQTVLAVIQAVILTMIFLLVIGKSREGIFFDDFTLEIMVTVWLTIMASMSMGLVISSIVKTGDKAMTLAPFVLIVQLLFSGILFELENAANVFSWFTTSRWSVEALGSIADMNSLDMQMKEKIPTLMTVEKDIYEHTAGHLLNDWMILAVMAVVCIVASGILLVNIKNDRR